MAGAGREGRRWDGAEGWKMRVWKERRAEGHCWHWVSSQLLLPKVPNIEFEDLRSPRCQEREQRGSCRRSSESSAQPPVQ